jgi:hypothetical protein
MGCGCNKKVSWVPQSFDAPPRDPTSFTLVRELESLNKQHQSRTSRLMTPDLAGLLPRAPIVSRLAANEKTGFREIAEPVESIEKVETVEPTQPTELLRNDSAITLEEKQIMEEMVAPIQVPVISLLEKEDVPSLSFSNTSLKKVFTLEKISQLMPETKNEKQKEKEKQKEQQKEKQKEQQKEKDASEKSIKIRPAPRKELSEFQKRWNRSVSHKPY